MKETDDIDTQGYWTVDNWAGLFGLLCYAYVCERLGETEEAAWARDQYDDLLTIVNQALEETIQSHNLPYIPASILEPNSQNRCRVPHDANWAAHLFFGRWPWDGWLLGGRQTGPSLDLIDSTYHYGFDRLNGAGFPPHTFGGYPGYCSSYNAGYGSAALRGRKYRAEGIRSYQFMIANAQSGPYSWWESIHCPTAQPWEGVHPVGGTGSCPHMWGQSAATKVLLDSLICERYDGKVIVGRGVPDEWIRRGNLIEVANFPISHNRRMGVKIEAVSDKSVKLTLAGDKPDGEVLFNLPIFENNVASATAGRVDCEEGIVTLGPGARAVTVTITGWDD